MATIQLLRLHEVLRKTEQARICQRLLRTHFMVPFAVALAMQLHAS